MPKITLNGKTVTCPLCGSAEWQSAIRVNEKGQIVSQCAQCRNPITTYPDY